MRRIAILSLALLALAACGRPAALPASPPKAVNPGPPLLPDPMPPGFVGRWASSAAQCADAAWVMTPTTLTAPAGSDCAFTQVTPNETGWIAEGTCRGERAAAPANLVLNTTRSGSPRTLAISGSPLARTEVLVACEGPQSGSAAAPVLAEAAAIDQKTAAPSAFTQWTFLEDELQVRAWRDGAAVVKLAEPLITDDRRRIGERDYYYRAEEADPFLIRDAGTTYVFQAGQLMGLYSSEGAELHTTGANDRPDIQAEMLGRARVLRQGAETKAPPRAPGGAAEPGAASAAGLRKPPQTPR